MRGDQEELIHSSEYREPSPFAGKEVLVAPASNSGSEIAFELARGGARKVWTAMRTPPPIFPREYLGFPLMYSGVLVEPLPDAFGNALGRVGQRIIYGKLTVHGLRALRSGCRLEPAGCTDRP